jgi:hypothetical protein
MRDIDTIESEPRLAATLPPCGSGAGRPTAIDSRGGCTAGSTQRRDGTSKTV